MAGAEGGWTHPSFFYIYIFVCTYIIFYGYVYVYVYVYHMDSPISLPTCICLYMYFMYMCMCTCIPCTFIISTQNLVLGSLALFFFRSWCVFNGSPFLFSGQLCEVQRSPLFLEEGEGISFACCFGMSDSFPISNLKSQISSLKSHLIKNSSVGRTFHASKLPPPQHPTPSQPQPQPHPHPLSPPPVTPGPHPLHLILIYSQNVCHGFYPDP